MTRRRTGDREDGAVAILVAVLAVVLLGCAALTVDLGNAWARKRDAQTQADVASIAAGNWARDAGLMPADQTSEQTAVRTKVAEYMLKSGNVITGQPAVTVSALTTRLGNGSTADGEVVFGTGGTSFDVLTPEARVDFGLAAALGQDHVDVQAGASIGMFSELPDRVDVLPFLLPSGCVYGPADADTTNGGGSGGGSSGGGTTPTNTNGSTSGPGVLTGATQSFQSTDEDNSHDQWTTETFTFRVVHQGNLEARNNKPIGDPVVHFQFRDDASVKYSIPGTWVSTPKNQQVWTFRITIEPDDVTSKSVQWYYQTQVGTLYSNVNNMNIQTKPAPSTPPPSTGCVGSSRGNFGQMDSPRKDTNGNNNRFAYNIAFGLDHQLEPLVNAAADECDRRPASTSPVRKAELHDDVSRDGNNCILPDPGNDGPKMYDGLITGVASKPGRLDIANGATKSGCNGGSNAVIGGYSINNDLLSCYLVNATDPLSRITATSGVTTGIIDPAVTKSPRFVWLPVVYRADRSSKTFQPILKFVPGFITDESAASTRTTPAYTDTTRDNGIQVNGNSIKVLTVFTFNPDALPVQESSPYMAYNPTVGRPSMKLTK